MTTSMIEYRTAGLSLKNIAGDVIWPKPAYDLSPSRKARYRLLGDWQKAILTIVDHKGLKEEV